MADGQAHTPAMYIDTQRKRERERPRVRAVNQALKKSRETRERERTDVKGGGRITVNGAGGGQCGRWKGG